MSSSTLPVLFPWTSVKEDQATIEQARREFGPNADPRKILARAMRIKERGKDKKSAAAWYTLQAELAQKAAQ
jgi:hypothetical protein